VIFFQENEMFRTGDVFVYSSVDLNDFFSVNTIGLDPGHTTVVLRGKEFESISFRGPSPSDTYVISYPSKIWPIEYFIYRAWTDENNNSLTVLRRKSGREVSSEEAFQVWNETLYLQRNKYLGYQRKILAYFKLNGLSEPGTINSCSELSSLILQKLGFVSPDAIVGNILPTDVAQNRFYQTVDYEVEPIFDKKLSSSEWLILAPFISLGWVESPVYRCKFVEDILEGYTPPPRIRGS
jgi:hypothetical protein